MTSNDEDYESAAAGLDYDHPIREKAQSLGSAIAENGPEALFEEIEKLLPDSMREQIVAFPLLAMIAGVGVGVFLGMRKGDEIIAAATSMVTAAAMSNVSQVMDRATGSRD